MKTILFGNYWQSNDTDKEPIEWVVLKEEDDKMYVLSKYCLDCVPYSDGHKLAWKNSLMRKWLNEDFINNAFSNEEQKKIMLSDVRTESGGWFGPRFDNGKAVKDKVFIPSIAEAILYFDSVEWHNIDAEQKRITRPTNYAYKKGCYAHPLKYGKLEWYILYQRDMGDSFRKSDSYWQLKEYNFNISKLVDDTSEVRWSSDWYLRTSGSYIGYVNANGAIYDSPAKNLNGTAVRPAMWIKK